MCPTHRLYENSVAEPLPENVLKTTFLRGLRACTPDKIRRRTRIQRRAWRKEWYSALAHAKSASSSHYASLLIFLCDSSNVTHRDVGAGRTQVALRGPSGMDAVRAAWVKEPDAVGPSREQMVLVTFSEKSNPL